MLNDPTNIPLGRLLLLFVALLASGTILTLPLYGFSWRRFKASSLYLKILWWIPITTIFLLQLYLTRVTRLVFVLILLAACGRELIRAISRQSKKGLFFAYYVVFGIALVHIALLGWAFPAHLSALLITIFAASVLSDVIAFFAGKYVGKHKLPPQLNDNKSWEGVLGQIVGAFLGVWLVQASLIPATSLVLFVPIGVGSALGDLANSFVKRKAGIKDWGTALPGHGGLLDRLSSLSGGALLTFYFVLALHTY